MSTDDVATSQSLLNIKHVKKFCFEWTIQDFRQKVYRFRQYLVSPRHLISPPLIFGGDGSADGAIPKGTSLLVKLKFLKYRNTHCRFDIVLTPSDRMMSLPVKIAWVISDAATGAVVKRMTDPDFLPVKRTRHLKFPYNSLPRNAKVELDVKFVTATEEKQASVFVQPFSTDLRDFFVNATSLADIELMTGDGKSIYTHKSLLAARSDVFNAMLTHKEMQEAISGKVKVEDMTSMVVEVFLTFLINDKVDWTEHSDMANKLLEAGDKYNVQGLKQAASQYIGKNCNIDNCVENLVLGHLYDQGVLDAAVDVLIKNREVIKGSPEWRAMKKNHPQIFASICETLLSLV